MRFGAFFFCAVFLSASVSLGGTTLNLTSAPGATGTLTGTVGGTAIFAVPTITQLNQLNSAGTGYIDSFLRLQANPASGSASPEIGFNTDARPATFADGTATDVKTDPNYTRSITLGEIPIITINSVQYRQFALDINEPASAGKSTLSLNELQIFVDTSSSDPNTNLANNYRLPPPNGGDSRTLNGDDGSILTPPVFDLGKTGYNTLLLDANVIGSGSGRFDLFVYIPNQDFAGFSADDHVILFNILGATAGAQADKFTDPDLAQGGFEEWFVIKSTSGGPGPGPGIVPEPSSTLLSLIGVGLLFVVHRRRKPSQTGSVSPN